MPAFTQGKWIYDEPFGVIVSDETCAVIASVQGAGTGSCFCLTQEGQANARLIAAAPDMYEALKECYDFIEDIICHDCEYCSRSLDAEGLRIALDDLFAGIDGKEVSA